MKCLRERYEIEMELRDNNKHNTCTNYENYNREILFEVLLDIRERLTELVEVTAEGKLRR